MHNYSYICISLLHSSLLRCQHTNISGFKIASWDLCFMLAGKPLLMLQSVKRALTISSTDPRVIGCVLRLQHLVQDKKVPMKAPVVQVLEKATESIFVYKSVKDGTDQFMQKNDKDLEHIFVGE